MRKQYLPISLLLLHLFTCTAFAYDTKGKFGMGIKIWGTPVITFSSMKIGIDNFLTLEPSLGYYRTTEEHEVTDYTYVNGVYKEVTTTNKYMDDFLNVTLLADLKPLRYEKSNLCVRAGTSYMYLSSHNKYGDRSPGYYDGAWSLSLLYGLGVEHFFSNWFSVNVGFLSGFGVLDNYDSGNERDDSIFLNILGNQLADFSLIWYLK